MLDGVIFGLQAIGGVSTYTLQLLTALALRDDVAVELRLPRRITGVDAAAAMALAPVTATDLLPTPIARIAPCLVPRGHIFHSAYYRVGLGSHVRQVTTVHDFIVERTSQGAAAMARRLQKAAAIRRADAVLCVSASTRRDLLWLYPAIDPARVFVVPLAYDPACFFADATNATGDTGDILFVGRRGGHKRFDLAVAAARAHPDLRLTIVGAAPDAAEHAMLTAGVGDRWRHLGGIDNAALRRLYANSHALIYPSDYEGFGLPLLEAMACGLPVVTNRGSSLGEVGGDAAVYSEAQAGEAYGAALARLRDGDVRRDHIARGLAQARRFSWAETAAQTVAVYRLL